MKQKKPKSRLTTHDGVDKNKTNKAQASIPSLQRTRGGGGAYICVFVRIFVFFCVFVDIFVFFCVFVFCVSVCICGYICVFLRICVYLCVFVRICMSQKSQVKSLPPSPTVGKAY